MALAADVGFAALTIEGIAARAGVGKQTIYRWWPTKADILLEAGAAKADLHVPVTDHGSYRADLRAFLEASYAMVDSVPQLADLRPDAATVADIVFGTIWYRILATRRPLDAGLADDLIAVLAPDDGRG